jgi:hypothetical protein
MHGDAEIARWPLPEGSDHDLSTVDRLARLQLLARRVGYSIRLDDPAGRLRELLTLAGLADIISGAGSAQDLAAVEVDGDGGEHGDQADRPDHHG